MTTFNITNIVPNLKEMTMTVFYEFSNGQTMSNTVPISTSVAKMRTWGQAKCAWFEDREEDVEEARRQLMIRTKEESYQTQPNQEPTWQY